MQWFKIHSEIKDDPKMHELDDHQKWLWICLLAMASESSERGVVSPWRTRGLANALRTTEEKLIATLAIWRDLEMIHICEQPDRIEIINWEKRQYAYPSDKPEFARKRKQESRASHERVTSKSRASHDTDTDTDTDPITADAVIGSPVPVPDPVEEPVSPPKATPKTPRPKPDPTAQQAMFGALAEVCVIDPQLKAGAGRIGKTAAELIAAGYTAEQVSAFKDWWYAFDWRGQRGDVPTLARVAELIKQSLTPRPAPITRNTQPERSKQNGFSPLYPQQNHSPAGGVSNDIDAHIAANVPAKHR